LTGGRRHGLATQKNPLIADTIAKVADLAATWEASERKRSSESKVDRRVFDIFKTKNGSRLFVDRQVRGELEAEEIRDRRIAALTPQDLRDGYWYEITLNDTLQQKDSGKARGGTGP
jgi:hypothetical protein